MKIPARMDDALREKIISKPAVILEDADVMRALIAATEQSMGGNVIDMRGIAMERLEARLDRLEETHRTVIAAAYENLAGTNQVHRAILRMLEPMGLGAFLTVTGREVADILNVDAVRLVLDETMAGRMAGLDGGSDMLCLAEPGFIEAYVSESAIGDPRPVTLRQLAEGGHPLYGAAATQLRSEACLLLDLGEGQPEGLLVLGSEDAHMFTPNHGGDLLAFFAGVFARNLRRFLA